MTLCIEWLGRRDDNGYGRVRWGTRDALAHRFIYAQFVADPGEFHVLHSCDNPPCVNPEHLFLGDQRLNNEDKQLKGRQARGEGHGMAKLTKERVLAIREAHANGFSQARIAADFNISSSAVSVIVTRKRWVHV